MKTSLPRIVLSLALLAVAACGGKESTPSTTPPGDGTGATTGTGDQTGSGAEVPSNVPMPGRGEPCSAEGDACAEGLECVTYYGIAGPKGPAFKSCENKCDAGQACPEGTTCQTIADGPGQVCR
jgi:hypothetical protein